MAAKVAIKGHADRGKKVIEILEMLGGKNICNYSGNREGLFYFIGPDPHNDGSFVDDIIEATATLNPNKYEPFHLDSFLKKFPYKVGDKVLVLETQKEVTITEMDWRENEVIYETLYQDDCFEWFAADELELYKEETMEEIKNFLIPTINFNEYCKDKYLLDLGNYEIKEESGKIYAVRKQLQYPKTYEECCKVLGVNPSFDIRMLEDEESTLYFKFIDLIRCRNAYWKIAGEQMGLGKPWEPEKMEIVYAIFYNFREDVIDVSVYNLSDNVILCFPTEEMRDAFFENFKDLIEQCKELL